MNRATFRCPSCGWAVRRDATYESVDCEGCGASAVADDGRCGPRGPIRVEIRLRPVEDAVTVLGVEEARRVGVAAIERAAKKAGWHS